MPSSRQWQLEVPRPRVVFESLRPASPTSAPPSSSAAQVSTSTPDALPTRLSDEPKDLGAELFDCQNTLLALVPQFVDGKQHGGALFAIGYSVGKADVEAKLLDPLLAMVKDGKSSLFHHGYVKVLREHGNAHDMRVRTQLDALEELKPELAVDLSKYRCVREAAERAIRLVGVGRLPAKYLGKMPAFLSEGDSLYDAVDAILNAKHERPKDRASAALGLLRALAYGKDAPLPRDPRCLAVIWRAVETAVDGAPNQEHVWRGLLRRLSNVDLERTVRLACKVAVEGDFFMRKEVGGETPAWGKR